MKRVVARHAGIAGWPGQSAVQKALWQAATERLPATRGADYTQAIMDLGATLCTARKPRCGHCPVSADCRALNTGRVHELPGRKPARTLPQRQAVFVCLADNTGRQWLQRRPGQGIWAGLWCLPQFDTEQDARHWLQQRQLAPPQAALWARFKHTFTHYKLQADVWRLVLNQTQRNRFAQHVAENSGDWLSVEQALAKGLPQPIRRLLEQHASNDLLSGA